ncbi:MAG TPA: recombination protein RecR [Lachnospiraceae bacterium]|nr:recombination protein RecR [Lachnospiraceae bacterium]
MDEFSSPVTNLIDELARLPGVGRKSAQRLAFHIIKMPKEEVSALAEAIVSARENVRYCKVCGCLSDEEVCPICADPMRDHSQIMVVESDRDKAAYERTGQYKGTYHILQGVISPLKGVSPDDLKIRELLERLRDGKVKEVIIATNPSPEGDTTAMYLSRLIKPLGVKVSRIANGVPVGGNLEYVDEVTLARALEGRIAW